MAANAKQAYSANSSLTINFFSVGNFNGSREYLINKNISKTGMMSFIRKITSTNSHYFVSQCQCFRHSVVTGSDPRRTLALNALWAQYLHWKQWSAVVYRDELHLSTLKRPRMSSGGFFNVVRTYVSAGKCHAL
jgi:hypothetical protein